MRAHLFLRSAAPALAALLLAVIAGPAHAAPRGAAAPRNPFTPAPKNLQGAGAKPEPALGFRSDSLDEGAVQSTLQQHQGAFRACATRAAQRQGSAGRLGKARLLLTVQPSGSISQVQVAESQLRGPALQRCLLEASRRVNFPPFRGPPVSVELPVRVAAR
ncbi:MAG: AgmX/PglI C-terminal domain-containing protein [Anaeromyxobacter sp.]